MASPASLAATSELDLPSSPVQPETKSFVSRAMSEDDDTQMGNATPDPREKSSRAKSKTSQSKDKEKEKEKEKDAANQPTIGKIRHLKKEDGEPLWREDIQYDFLKAVFDNEQTVFTNSYEPDRLQRQCFADLYIDTMSRSSKTSKVLRDKLLSDREAAKGMAMVCLLVNMGRMNTTLNFFPEMRAQLRTYHAIPSLQARQDPHAYKQLQDAPRLKSILKGGADDREEPNSLDKIKALDTPRTNPVNLIFVMCNAAQKIKELHFPRACELHDLIMKTEVTSQSRANAFLWLMWFYLESDFTEEGCEENPFGAGVDYRLDVANQGVPQLIGMTEEQQARENVDTEEEIEFGRTKQKMRAKILEMDQAYLNERDTKRGKMRPSFAADEGPAILPRIRPSKHESDMDSTRSTPPPRALGGRGLNSSRRGAPLKYQIFEGASSPAHHVNEGVVARKPRPPTAHQLAVERNRSQRVEYILDRGLRRQHHKSRKLRRQDGAIFRAYQRVNAQEDPFEDSDDENSLPRNLTYGDKTPGLFREKGVGGLCLLTKEKDDFGEEVSAYAAALRRATRRLARWRPQAHELGVIPAVKRPRPKKAEEDDGDLDLDDDIDGDKQNGDLNGDVTLGDVTLGDLTVGDMTAGDMTMGDVTMDDAEIEDQTVLHDDDEVDDADRTEVMGDSDID